MKLGFLGAGRMATALAQGCIRGGVVAAADVIASDPSDAARAKFASDAPGVRTAASNSEVVAASECIVLAVKPQMMADVLVEVRGDVESRHLVVSIAAGVTLARLAEALPDGTRLIRVMPNTPCLIGLGASAFARGAASTNDDAAFVQRLLESVGKAYAVEESQLDAVTGLSGSGPAFIYTAIEALAEGGASMGLPAGLALELAAQTALGAASMLGATGLSPAELRNQVTSPGGTTLEGLEALDRLQGAAAFRAAVQAATKRSAELGRS
ncbi:MAG TPA: pyrroline-5-carboxylate reductase [Lacipirellulaceae bacterium]|nr:pyrroline-5-carboxylate reductase [Lacipirellulaceae bacterium]